MSSKDATPRAEEETVRQDIDALMQRSYTDYAMSVIIGRALPDVRDGFKPVHRRCLYAMHDMGNRHDKPYKKSARIVGDVIGKYHPHGDTAVYDTIVRMAQPFSLRMPLVDGQGNFGSVDGDSPAAMRYTEIRLSPLSSELLVELPKETVDWNKNYDASLDEPSVLPVRFPQLLVNGSSGIAVGMATSIPPHNLAEVITAAIMVLDNPLCTVEDLMGVLPGPDFPTGAQIIGRDGIEAAYSTGRGKILVRARSHVEKLGRDRQQIVFTEIPYQVNKLRVIEKIAELVNEKKLEAIADIRDESDRDGMRMVVELRKDANATRVLADLYRHTQLQSTFGVIMLAISDAMPKVLPLKGVLQAFVNFRRQTVLRRTRYDLTRAEERLHILAGLMRALGMLDEIISLIRASKSPDSARGELMSRLGFSQAQSQAILDMRLQRLTALEMSRLAEEHGVLEAEVSRLQRIMASQAELDRVIKQELQTIAADFQSPRRTEIAGSSQVDAAVSGTAVSGSVIVEQVCETDYVIAISAGANVIKIQPDQFRRLYAEGGLPALSGAMLTRPDGVLLAVTAAGKLYWLRPEDIPELVRGGGWKSFAALLQSGDDPVVSLLPISGYGDGSLVTVSRLGQVKRTLLSDFANQRVTGIVAAGVEAGDAIMTAFAARDDSQLLLATSAGMGIRFSAADVRQMGRAAGGVRGITLKDGAVVVSAIELRPEIVELLIVTDAGFWKRVRTDELPLQGRGGSGVIIVKTGAKNGSVSNVSPADGCFVSVAGVDAPLLVSVLDAPLMGRPALGEKFTFASVKPNIEGVINIDELIKQGGQQ